MTKKIFFTFSISLITIAFFACQPKQKTELSEADKNAIVDSTRRVVQQVFDLSNKLDFISAAAFFSPDADARFIENGSIYPSLDALRKTYEQITPTLDVLENKIDKWDITVLSKDAVAMTLPVHFKIKAKGLSEYNGQYVWSGILQKRNSTWVIVQFHESWLNYAEAIAAMTPPKTDNKK